VQLEGGVVGVDNMLNIIVISIILGDIDPKPKTQNPKPKTQNPKPPKLQTPNPKLQTPNPKLETDTQP
jgi:hypothetical protein